LANRAEMNQDELDSVLARLKPGEPLRANNQTLSQALPKGIDRLTLRRVIDALADAPDSLTAMQMARTMGASRSTARRYLEFLVAEQAVSAELGYGDVGRPERRYRLLETAHKWLESL